MKKAVIALLTVVSLFCLMYGAYAESIEGTPVEFSSIYYVEDSDLYIAYSESTKQMTLLKPVTVNELTGAKASTPNYSNLIWVAFVMLGGVAAFFIICHIENVKANKRRYGYRRSRRPGRRPGLFDRILCYIGVRDDFDDDDYDDDVDDDVDDDFDGYDDDETFRDFEEELGIEEDELEEILKRCRQARSEQSAHEEKADSEDNADSDTDDNPESADDSKRVDLTKKTETYHAFAPTTPDFLLKHDKEKPTGRKQ